MQSAIAIQNLKFSFGSFNDAGYLSCSANTVDEGAAFSCIVMVSFSQAVVSSTAIPMKRVAMVGILENGSLLMIDGFGCLTGNYTSFI